MEKPKHFFDFFSGVEKTALLLDASGVLYQDGRLFPNVAKAVAQWQSEVPVYLATNNTSASPATIATHLAALGIEISPTHILSSGLTLAADPTLRGMVQGKSVFLHGPADSGYYVLAAGGYLVSVLAEADVLVIAHAQGGISPYLLDMLDWQQCGHRPVICINPDQYVATHLGLYPVAGTLAKNFICHWAGKPHANYAVHVVGAALQAAGIVADKQVWFVDDNPENVMAMSTTLGISCALVTETGLAQYSPWREWTVSEIGVFARLV